MSKYKNLTTVEWLLFIVVHNSLLFFWMMMRHVKEAWQGAWRFARKQAFLLMRRGDAKDFAVEDFRESLEEEGGADLVEEISRVNFLLRLLKSLGFSEEDADMFTAQVLPFQSAMYAFDRAATNHVRRVGSFKTVGDALQLWYDYKEVNERSVHHFFGDQYDTVYATASYAEAYKILKERMSQNAASRSSSTTFNPTGAQYAPA